MKCRSLHCRAAPFDLDVRSPVRSPDYSVSRAFNSMVLRHRAIALVNATFAVLLGLLYIHRIRSTGPPNIRAIFNVGAAISTFLSAMTVIWPNVWFAVLAYQLSYRRSLQFWICALTLVLAATAMAWDLFNPAGHEPVPIVVLAFVEATVFFLMAAVLYGTMNNSPSATTGALALPRLPRRHII